MVSIPSARMDQIAARHAELSAEMARPDLPPEKFVALSKEYAELTPVAEAAAHVLKLRDDQDTLAELAEHGAAHAETWPMAREGLEPIRRALPDAERELGLHPLPLGARGGRPAERENRPG